MSNSRERISTAVFVTGSALTTYFFSNDPDRTSPTSVFREQQRIFDKNIIIPSNLTFALIWPVIYSGGIALAIHQALPNQADNPRYRKARPWFWVSYSLNALFAYYFSRSDRTSRLGATIITIATLPPALMLHRALEIGRTEVPLPERIFRKSVSLYAGWLTIASVVGGANLLLDNNYRPSEKVAIRWATVMLPATTALGLSGARRLRDPYYPLGHWSRLDRRCCQTGEPSSGHCYAGGWLRGWYYRLGCLEDSQVKNDYLHDGTGL